MNPIFFFTVGCQNLLKGILSELFLREQVDARKSPYDRKGVFATLRAGVQRS